MPRYSKTRLSSRDIAARLSPLLFIDAATGVVALDHRVNERNHGTTERAQPTSKLLRTPEGFAAFVEVCELIIGRDQDWRRVNVKVPYGHREAAMLVDTAKHRDVLAAVKTVYPKAVHAKVAA